MPEGVRFSLSHFLTVPYSHEIAEALDNDNDKHLIVKCTRIGSQINIERLDEVRSVLSSFFETDSLQHQKLCFLTTATLWNPFSKRLICDHSSKKLLPIIKYEQKCPHDKSALSLYCYCENRDLELRKNYGVTDVCMDLIIQPSEVCTVSVKLGDNSIEDKYKISHEEICKNNGSMRIGAITAGFEDPDCKTLKMVYFNIGQKQDEFNLEMCEHIPSHAPRACNGSSSDQQLPTTHFKLPAEYMTTGISPTVSHQCTSQAVEKAVVAILEDHGYGYDKQQVI